MTKQDQAESLFNEGYNCAQAVLGAFDKETGLSKEQAMKLAAPFGGGIGRTGETCGALTGLLMAYALMKETGNKEDKLAAYERTRSLMDAFKKDAGSVFCRELKGAGANETLLKNVPEAYKNRPCVYLVRLAVAIGEKEGINEG